LIRLNFQVNLFVLTKKYFYYFKIITSIELQLLLGVVNPPLVAIDEQVTFEAPRLICIYPRSDLNSVAKVLAGYYRCQPGCIYLTTRSLRTNFSKNFKKVPQNTSSENSFLFTRYIGRTFKSTLKNKIVPCAYEEPELASSIERIVLAIECHYMRIPINGSLKNNLIIVKFII
jgi:hypothetical protein